jgi:hypothetical protein
MIEQELIPQAHGGALRPRGGPGRTKGKKTRSKISRLVLETKAKPFLGGHYHSLIEKYPGIEDAITVEEVMTIVQAHKAIFKEDTNAYTALINNAYKPLERGNEGGNTYIFTSNLNNPHKEHETIDVEIQKPD